METWNKQLLGSATVSCQDGGFSLRASKGTSVLHCILVGRCIHDKCFRNCSGYTKRKRCYHLGFRTIRRCLVQSEGCLSVGLQASVQYQDNDQQATVTFPRRSATLAVVLLERSRADCSGNFNSRETSMTQTVSLGTTVWRVVGGQNGNNANNANNAKNASKIRLKRESRMAHKTGLRPSVVAAAKSRSEG